MTDQSIAFSSSFVTNKIAERTVRGLSLETPLDHVKRVVRPLMVRFGQGGKLKQANFSMLAKAIAGRLRAEPTLLDVQCQCLVKAPSPREAYRIRFVIRDSQTDAHCTLMVGEVMISRRSATIRMNDTLVRINTHVLSRYMQRENRSTDSFFQDVIAPFKLVPAIVSQACAIGENIAIPMGSGLLFGKIAKIEEPDHTGVGLEFSTNQAEPDFYLYTGRSFFRGGHSQVTIKTYCDEMSLNYNRLKVRDQLRAFQAEHSVAAELLFDSMVHDCTDDLPHEQLKSCEIMMKAAETIVNGPEWARFCDSVQW